MNEGFINTLEDGSEEVSHQVLLELQNFKIEFPYIDNRDGDTLYGPSSTEQSMQGPNYYTHRSLDHASSVLSRLNQQRKEGTACDIILQCGPLCVPAHKNILGASSEYFFEIFKTSTSSKIEMPPDLDETTFAKLLDFVYTGEICITTDTVQSMLAMAIQLKLVEVQEACWEFLKQRLHTLNCFRILRLAELAHNDALVVACLCFIGQHIDEILKEDDQMLLRLEDKQFQRLISTAHMSEDRRLEAIVRWVTRDPTARQDVGPQLCKHVQVSGLSQEYLKSICQMKEQMGTNPWLTNFLLEALSTQLQSVKNPTMPETKPIKTGSYMELIVVAGGVYPYTDVESFDLLKQCWISTKTKTSKATPTRAKIPDLPHARIGCAAVVVDDLLYILGGRTSDVTSSVVIYNQTSHSWVAGPEMQCARTLLGAAVLHGKIYVIGGTDNVHPLDTAEVLDPETDKWCYISSLWCPRSSPGVTAWREQIFVAGGLTYDKRRLSSVEVYDPNTNVWTTITSMSFPRSALGLCALGGCLYAVGGSIESDTFCANAEAYNPETDSWYPIARMNTKRSGLGLVAHGGFLYAVCGQAVGKDTSAIERYNPSIDKWTTLPGKMKTHRFCAGIAVLPMKLPE